MRLRLLGRVGIETDQGFVEADIPKQRTLLALLGVAGGLVSADRLIDQMWDEDPPSTARKALQNQVSSLRKLLPKALIATEPGGYRLTIGRDEVDTNLFHELVEQGRRARVEGQIPDATRLITSALELWEGDPFPGCVPCETLVAQAAALQEVRLGAIEEQISLEIDSGRPEEVVARLETLVADQPMREGFWRLLMRAHYACGRQVDALDTYQRARSQLIDELGVEPGPELRELELAVLDQRSELDDGTRLLPPPPIKSRDIPNNIPRYRTDFFGRKSEMKEIAEHLEKHRLVTLTGFGGSGKTRLAVETAREALTNFPDGLYFVDLSNVDSDTIWDQAAKAIGLAPSPSPLETPRAGVLRYLEDRRALLVVDNCEHVIDSAARTVEELLDQTDQVEVVATSRESLRLDGERVIKLSALPIETDAVDLFNDRATAAMADPIREDIALDICKRVDGMPLAIELAAAMCGQLGSVDVSKLLENSFKLHMAPQRRPARQQTLEATINWSYDLLDSEQQTVFRRLSVFKGSFNLQAVTQVCGREEDAQIADAFGALVDKSLVDKTEGNRFLLLEAIREFAELQLIDVGEAEEARRLHLEWLESSLDAFGDRPSMWGSPEAVEFLQAELDNLRIAMARLAKEERWEPLTLMACLIQMHGGQALRDSLAPFMRMLQAALDSGIAGDLRVKGLAIATISATTPGVEMRSDFLDEFEKLGWDDSTGHAIVGLAFLALALDFIGLFFGDDASLARAGEILERSAFQARSLDRDWQVIPLFISANIALNHSDWERATTEFERFVSLREETWPHPLGPIELLCYASGMRGGGQPLQYSELVRLAARAAGLDTFGGLDLLLMALAAPESVSFKRPIHLDRSLLDRTPIMHVSSFLIAVALFASSAQDWVLAARLAAATGTVAESQQVFASQPGVALYHILQPELERNLDSQELESLEAEGLELGVRGGLDLAINWLAEDPSQSEPKQS